MNKSTHRVEVVPVTLEPHPNADSLSVVRVFGYTVCVRTSDWGGVNVGAYIPPDSVVDSKRPDFAFLEGHERIKVKKLRGVVSMGLLMPTPNGASIGDDVAEQLGVTHYEPPESLVMGGDSEVAPPGYHPTYDVDSLRRYADRFILGEDVWVTEKIHGANGRFCYVDSRMRCGSRTMWKKDDPQSIWWKALAVHPEVATFCQDNPGITVYGEVYGQVQDLRYGTRNGEVHIAVFDLLLGTEWINPQAALDLAPKLPWVPRVAITPFYPDDIFGLAEGPSFMPGTDHVREGIVVKPMVERQDLEIGRVCLKVVGNGYLELKQVASRQIVA